MTGRRESERASRRLKLAQEREEMIRRRDAAMQSSSRYQSQRSQQAQSQQTPISRPTASQGRGNAKQEVSRQSKRAETTVQESSEASSSPSPSSSSSSSSEDSSEDEARLPSPDSVLQRLILAGMMKHGVQDIPQMTELFRRCCAYVKVPFRDEFSTFAGISAFIKGVNENISKYKMSIKTATRCEFTGKQYFMFKADETPVAKLQSTFKKAEVDMIQNCINAMLMSDNFSISLRECVDVARKDNTKVTMNEAQTFIERLIDMFYFATNVDEPPLSRYNYYVTLGFRAVEELSAIIQERQPGVIGGCRLCFQPCLHAFKCPNPTCEVLVHKVCAKNFLEKTHKCPGELGKPPCNATWEDFNSLTKRIRIVNEGNTSQNEGDSSIGIPTANSSLEETVEPVAGPSNASRVHSGNVQNQKQKSRTSKKSKKVAVISSDSD